MRLATIHQHALAVLGLFVPTMLWAIGATPPTWKPRETVATGNNLYGGSDRTIAYDHHGNPVVVFFDDTNGDLRYARRLPGVGWANWAIDTGGVVGERPSLAYDRFERPAISYYDTANEDANGDRDALDIGERMLWASGFNSPQGMTSNGRVVYVAEEGFADGSNQVVRLLDVNGDADALDVGERSIWLNGLDDPADVSYDGSAWFLSEVDEEQIFRLTDVNDDGDVLDIGERALYADDIGAPQHILTQSGSLIVPSFTGDQINRLRDANNDGDALDVGENNVVIVQNFGGLAGVLDDGAGGFFFTSLAVDAVYHARDVNGDSDMLDIGEVLPYADPVYGWLNDPTGLVATATGFLLADSLNNQIKLVHDLNGDGDALDFGDVIVFADGIVRPHDIVALQITPPSDFNIDGNVDVADYVAWQKLGGTSAQYYAWTSTFGETAVTSGTSNGTVPEPDGAALFWTLAAAALGWKSAGQTSHARCAV